MADARKRQFDVVAVWKLDRWGRSVSHSIASIQELTALGIAWQAITQGLDTSNANPTSNLLLHILHEVGEGDRRADEDLEARPGNRALPAGNGHERDC